MREKYIMEWNGCQVYSLVSLTELHFNKRQANFTISFKEDTFVCTAINLLGFELEIVFSEEDTINIREVALTRDPTRDAQNNKEQLVKARIRKIEFGNL